MGKFGFATWTLHMASIIIFSTMWGWIFHEWKGSSKKAHGLIAAGIADADSLHHRHRLRDLHPRPSRSEMSSPRRPARFVKPIRGLRWYIGGLFFLSTVINYIDRQTLSVLAPYLKVQYTWTNADFALIVISFRVAYAIGQTGAGQMLDRIGTRRGLSIGVGFYSVAAMLTSLASGLRSFCFFRFLLGAGESANWPGATKGVSEWFPRRESGWAVALFDSGSSIGGAVAPLLVLWIYHTFGSWRPAFIITGALGFGWLLLFRWFYHPPETHPRLSAEERAYILADRPAPTGGRRRLVAASQRPHAARPAADLGRHRRQDADRPGLVLHHRLVRDLPRVTRVQARGQPVRLLGAVPRGRRRQLPRRRRVERADQARAGRSAPRARPSSSSARSA